MKTSDPGKQNFCVAALAALSLNCKDAARLQSEALDGKLPFLQRAGLRMHVFFCIWCRRYGKQLELLRGAAKQPRAEDPKPTGHALSPESKQRIKGALQSNRD